MSWPGEVTRRIRMFLQRDQFDANLEEEMQLHVELRRQQQIEVGVSPEVARSTARRLFGNEAAIKEKSHMTWGWNWLETLLQDAVYGIRSMLRSPALVAVALLSLALGIGANTAIFSLLDAVMLRSLPVKQPSQLVLLGKGEWNGISDAFAITELYSYPFYREMQKNNAVFTDVAGIFSMLNNVHGFVEGRDQSEPMKVQLVSGTYFPTLGVNAIMGRALTDDDDKTEGNHPVAVISYAWWASSLARDPSVLSKKLKIGETTFDIVGVAPPEFFGTKVGDAPDIWVPLSMMQQVPPNFTGYADNFSESLYLMGRLKPGVTLEQATTNVNLVFQQILRGFPDATLSEKNLEKLKNAHVPLTQMTTGLSSLRRKFSEPLKILMAVVALVLSIACANIANLLLARSTARARELAVRQALGARRARLIRQLLTESLVLAITGGALGILFASIGSRLLLRMVSGGPDTVPLDVSINPRLLIFTLAVTVATAVLFGTIPAFRATKLQIVQSLKDGRGSQGTGAAKSPLAQTLVVSQVALSLVLLVGAGLFLRSLVNLNNVDTGFNKENVLRLQIDASSIGYKAEEPRLKGLYQQIEERVSALPGVRAASFSSFTFHQGSWNTTVTVPGGEAHPEVDVKHNVIGNGYFATMQIPLLAGRTFGPQDTATSQKVAVISERMARTMFPAGSPIGHHYMIGNPINDNDREVIGIVKDVKFGDLQEDPETLDYVPYTQRDDYLSDFEVRYAGDFNTVSTSVQRTIHDVSHNLPITRVTTLDEQVARSITDQRLVAQLSAFFGLLAVFLSCIGIYGLMSYVVARRTNEIGIRMALGAERSNVRWLVMREVLALVAIGVVAGVPIALAGSRLISNMLFGVRGTDPASMVAAVGAMIAVAIVAGYLPARRASRIEPMAALRYE
jgi:predicted permease